MPSHRHELLAWALPRLRKSRELDSIDAERARIERWHLRLEPSFPSRLVPRFARRFTLTTEQLDGPAGAFPSYTIVPRGTRPRRTVVYLHGGGFVGPIDPFHVRYVARLATTLQARVVVPDYPLAPEHSWRDSHATLADQVARLVADSPDGVVLAGDSAGGGYALALALTLRDRGGPQPRGLLLHSPWVDLTTSTPDTEVFAMRDSWLFLGKIRAYAEWWAGTPDDLPRAEVSPALAALHDLPPALMFCGTRDVLAPGCRLLAERASDAGWALDYVELPDLIHVFPLMPLIPEARSAWRRTIEFLRQPSVATAA